MGGRKRVSRTRRARRSSLPTQFESTPFYSFDLVGIRNVLLCDTAWQTNRHKCSTDWLKITSMIWAMHVGRARTSNKKARERSGARFFGANFFFSKELVKSTKFSLWTTPETLRPTPVTTKGRYEVILPSSPFTVAVIDEISSWKAARLDYELLLVFFIIQFYLLCPTYVSRWYSVREVKEMDLKSIGVMPRKFESCLCRLFFFCGDSCYLLGPLR